MALLNNSSKASDFGIDVPVVMLELPESLVTSEAPAQYRHRRSNPGTLDASSSTSISIAS